MRRLADAIEAELAGARDARGAQRRQADRRRARRDRDGRRVLPLLRRGARAPARPHDPGRRRRRHDLPRAARRRRPDHALELPAGDRLVEGRAGARGGQHGRPQAGRADPADRARARADRARGGAARGRAQRRRRARVGLRPAAGRAPRRRQDRLHRLDRGRPRDRRRRRADDQAGDARARRQVGERRSSPTPTSRRRPRPRRARCSATPARTAARARGSWSSAAAMDEFLAALERARAPRCVVGDPLDERDRDGAADLRRPARDGRLLRPRRRARSRSAARRPTAPASGSRRPCSRRCRTPTAPRARRSSARSPA